MKEEDFVDIMDVKNGGCSDFNYEASGELLVKFAENEEKKNKDGTIVKIPYISRKKVLEMLRVGDEKDAKRAYDLLALLRVILPSSRQKLSVKYLYAIDHVEELQWASCAFTTMMQSISTYQKDKARSQSQIGGCLLFLQLFYIKAVSPPAGSPFLHSVTKDTVIKVFNDYKKIQKSSDHAPEGEEEFMKFEVDHIQTEMEKMMQIRVQKVDDQKKKQIVTEVYTTMLHAVYNQTEILKSSFSETRDKEEEEEVEDEEEEEEDVLEKICQSETNREEELHDYESLNAYIERSGIGPKKRKKEPECRRGSRKRTKPSPLAQSSVQTSSSQPETCALQPSSSKPSNIPFHIHSSAPSPLFTMKKLLVLDINGVLADVINGDVPEQIKANHGKFGKRHFLLPLNTDPNVTELHKGRTYVAKRPHCDEFIRFCLEHFVVAVWSSKVSKNVNDLVNMLFGFPRPNLFFVWHQDHCENRGRTMTGKTIYSKPLKKVWLWWQDYSSNNTLLIDDSQEKTSMNPEGNVLCPPTYFYDYNSPDNSLGPDGEFRKYLKGLAKAESVPEYSKNTSFGLTR